MNRRIPAEHPTKAMEIDEKDGNLESLANTQLNAASVYYELLNLEEAEKLNMTIKYIKLHINPL